MDSKKMGRPTIDGQKRTKQVKIVLTEKEFEELEKMGKPGSVAREYVCRMLRGCRNCS